MAVHRKVYRFRMRPTPIQESAMLRQAGACRFVWNWGLARRKEHYEATGKTLAYVEQARELTALKRQEGMGWLSEVANAPLQQTLRDLDRAFANFFNPKLKARYPRFKSRKRCLPAFRYPERVQMNGDRVTAPKLGKVRIRGSREIDGNTKGASFKRDATGRWHVAIVAEFEMPDAALPPPDPAKVVGIDFGLKEFAVTSDGEHIASPRFYRTGQRKLRRAQRALSRRKAGSNRRARAKHRVARILAKIADQRSDFLHKFTTGIVRDHDGVCIEDLNVKGLARTKLAKSFHDAALGEARRQLTYKATWHRRHLAVIDRFCPSSKRCRDCHAIKADLALKDRHWTCEGCGAVHDRDENAAGNILDEGMEILAPGHGERRNARGVGVSPSKGGRR